ncbi:unnamed protein product [Dovyalis caffra]|uniref:Uncharacterized protein n=1 Tax=Dovyalis caffra TaxID=77055 RepID=A0AAV1RMI2_9ROSI|nr:unnamed protein product [Dovyalis caffra]
MSEVADPAEVQYDDKDNCRWIFKPRGLHITWSENPSYWRMPEIGTDGPAELQNVWWLEIFGSTPEPLSEGERYALSFKISLSGHNFGWENAPAYMLAKVGKKGRANWAKINIADMNVGNVMEIPDGKLQFEVPKHAEDTTLHFGLYELWSGRPKGGLRVHEAVVEKMPVQSITLEHIDEEIKVISISLDIKGSIRVHIHHGSLSKLIIYRLLFALKMSEAAGRAEVESDKVGHVLPAISNKCRWSFKPRELHITWSENPSYWKMPEKGTDGPAELQRNYGWHNIPAYMMAKVGKKGIAKWAKINIADMTVDNEMEVPYGKLRFEVPKYAEDTILNFGLYELWTGKWKGGLLIHEAVVEKMPD